MALMSPTRPEDQLQMTMGTQPAQLGVVQHPMHAMIAPLEPAPSEIDPAVAMGMSPDQPDTSKFEQPKVKQMSATDQYKEKLAQKQMSDLQKDANPYGSENNHPGFFGKLLHGLSVATGGPNRRAMAEAERNNQIRGIEKQEGEQAQQQAQTEHLQQQTAAGVPVEISPEQANELEAPELAGTKVAPAVLAQLYKQRGINDTRVETNQNTVQGRRDVANIQALSREQIAQLKPEQRDDRAIRLNQKVAQGEPLTQEEQAYLKAYHQYIDETKVAPGVARAQAFAMFRPVQTIRANGDVVYQTAGNAIKSGSATPQSMNFRTASQLARYMTSGKGGSTLTAYRTAYDHLDLLQNAADALQNGDVQGLNRLSNAFKEQFGHAAPTNFDAVKTMLAGEIANVAKASGATDQEIAAARAELNRAQSPEQIRGIIETNQDLMDQKAKEMFYQYQNGMQGQPVFGHGGATAPGASPAASSQPQRPPNVPPNAQYITDPKTGKKGWAW